MANMQKRADVCTGNILRACNKISNLAHLEDFENVLLAVRQPDISHLMGKSFPFHEKGFPPLLGYVFWSVCWSMCCYVCSNLNPKPKLPGCCLLSTN